MNDPRLLHSLRSPQGRCAPLLGLLGLVCLLALAGCGGDEPAGGASTDGGASGDDRAALAQDDPGAGEAPDETDDGAAQDADTGASEFGHRRKRFGLEAVVTPAPADAPEDAPARIHGVARLEGLIPERKPIAMDFIAGCRKHGPGLTETVIATEDGRLQNVVVNILRGFDRDEVPPAPDEPAVLTQEGCVFKPHVVVVRAGQTLKIENKDTANHNVNAKPSHGSNEAFNRMQAGGGAAMDVVFERAEVAIPIGCDIHPFMKAWVAVVDHPYYAVSDEEGAWSIELPAGDYLVEAWHERYGTLKGTVELAPGESAEFAFQFEAAKQRR